MIDTMEIRCRILELAFAGKLSSPMNGDDSVEDMLLSNRITSFNEEKGAPHDIPKHWKWVKLSELYDINPKVNASDSVDAAFVPMERISAGFNNTFSYETQSWNQASKNHTKFMNGDVCFAKISPCFENRKSFVADDLPNSIGGGTTELIVLRQQAMNPLYTYYIVNDRRFIQDGSASYKGIVGQQRVKSDIINNYLVPVPPYKEQVRIVETIKRIFQEIDKIDQYQSQYASDLEVLKSKLIDAGIRGKLTERLSEDGFVKEQVNSICPETNAIIEKEEQAFEIPDNWYWIKLGWVIDVERGGSPRPIKSYLTNDANGINWIKIGDVEKDGKYITSTKEKIKPEGEKKSRRVYPGDFLLTNSMSFGRPYISKITGCVHDGWLILRNSKGLFNLDFLYLLLSSTYAYNQFCKKASGATVDNLNKDKVSDAIMPLPPLSEQKRIVERLEAIMEQL